MSTALRDARLSDAALRTAHSRSAELVRRTPLLSSASISARCGGCVVLKAECLQRTGSFKLRGALNKLRGLGDDRDGVVAGSAGNHAQALAYAARHHGIRCEVFMPLDAAVSKLAAVRAFGAIVHRSGASVDECVMLARERAREARLEFVHPFDDVDVIAGQAGVGIELVDDIPDLAKAIVPVGGGGLASGTAIAIKSQRPEVEVVGIQAAACAPYPASLHAGHPIGIESSPTIADGIAIKRPGEITMPLVEQWLDDVATVNDDAIARAMVLLLERSKLVVEGAAAASLAALLDGTVKPAMRGTTVVVLSGGNVDPALLAAIAAREETRAGRRIRIYTRVPDRPGGLATLLTAVASAGANLISVDHVRDGVPLDVRETGLELTLATEGEEHADQVVAHLAADGYRVERLRSDS